MLFWLSFWDWVFDFIVIYICLNSLKALDNQEPRGNLITSNYNTFQTQLDAEFAHIYQPRRF